MIKAEGIKGAYLEYKGLPLVREGNELYYGDMSDNYYLFIMIMSEKNNEKLKVSLPDKVMIQIIDTKDPNNILKQKVTNGLADAFEIGTAWLERANRDKA